MKYIAIIDTDDYKDFEFFEDANGKYMAVKDAGATTSGEWIPLYFTECKQESILNKMRADIEGLTYYWCEVNPKTVIDEVLDIIDKYKTEGEDEK